MALPRPKSPLFPLLHLPMFHVVTTYDFIYDDGFSLDYLNITDGSAITSSGALLLTNSRRLQSMGHAFYYDRQHFKDPSDATNTTVSFSTQFIFVVVSETESLGGNGFTFAITTSMLSNTTDRDYLGLVNNSTNGNFSNRVVAVEFDTHLDTWLRDINDNHVGVDINGVISSTLQTAAYFTNDGKNKTIDLKFGELIPGWIDYNASEKLLDVTIAPISFSSKPIRPLISYSVDLSPVLLPTMYVGFTADMSNSASDHYILAWSFTTNGKAL